MANQSDKFIKDSLFGFLLVLPALLLLFLLVVFPVIYVLYLSTLSFDTTPAHFVGLKHYAELLTNDSFFWIFFGHSMQYVVFAIGSAFFVALLVALSLNTINKFQGTLRTFALWCWAVPPVIASLMWKWMLNDTNGALNDILLKLGVIHQQVAWLALPHWTMIILSQVHAWTAIPFIMVILLAGLQAIPVELYEVASIDGANGLQKFRTITYPLLRTSVLTSVMLSSIFAFRHIDIVFTLTKGGPGEATELLVTYLYDNAFNYMKIGYSAALSIIMVFISMVIVFLLVKLIRPQEQY